MRWILRILAATVVIAAGMGSAQPVQSRVALVIANANYSGYPALPNAATDAELVRETLARAGFRSVEVRADIGVAAFRAALATFRSAAEQADVALVYYAGHAVEVAGRNWLIPRDAALQSDADLPAQSIDAVDVFTAMEGAKTRIVVLDACRENPFEVRLRSAGARGVGRGLGAPTAASGLADLTRMGDSAQGALLMYSAAPGRVADDGIPGQGSPFARAFQKYFAEPDLELRFAVGKISDAVAAETSNRQLPFSTLSLSGVPLIFVVNAERSPPPSPTTPGAEFRDCSECPLMVVIPTGSFMMGSPPDERGRGPDEGPQRQVTIARRLAVSKFEVTFAEFDVCAAGGGCMEENGYPHEPVDWGWGRGTRPVIEVNWQDARHYVEWLNKKVGGRAYRLLSEAEWEFAARGGTTTPYSTGAEITEDQARFHIPREGNGPATVADFLGTVGVGSFPANAFGLHDMHGNVLEWVDDCYQEHPQSADGRPVLLRGAACADRVVRGGAWGTMPGLLRSARRLRFPPTTRARDIGFRVARDLGPI